MNVLLGIVGAGLGSLSAWSGATALGWSIGSLLGGILEQAQTRQDVGRLDDLRVSGSSYGVPLPRIWGKARVGTNAIWAADLVEHVDKRKVGDTRGIGGTEIRSWWYTGSAALAVCLVSERQSCYVRRIWADSDLLYDAAQNSDLPDTIRFYPGSPIQEPDSLLLAHAEARGEAAPAYRGTAYLVFENLNLAPYGNRFPQINAEVETFAAIPLPGLPWKWATESPWTVQTILEDICQEVGLSEDQYDFTEGGAYPVRGFVNQSRSSAREVIAPLLTAYAIDLVERDGLLTLTPRHLDNPAVSIPASATGSRVWEEGSPQASPGWEVARASEGELPDRLEVGYYDADRLEEIGMQSAQRYTKTEGRQHTVTVNLPLTLTATEARQLAERLLYLAWWERTVYRTTLPLSFARLAPASVVETSAGGQTKRFRVTRLSIPFFGPLSLEAVEDDPAALVQTSEGDSGPAPAPIPLDVSTTYAHVFHTNALRAEDAGSVGIYLAAGGASRWGGAVVMVSRDSGASWQVIETLTEAATLGWTEHALARPSDYQLGTARWDTVSRLTVALERGVLESVSMADVLEGENAALVGREVIQFTTATPLGNGRYELSNLLRGRQGTNVYYNHRPDQLLEYANARFVLLDNALRRYSFDDGLINRSVWVKVVPSGMAPGDIPHTVIGPLQAELTPWMPADVRVVREGNDDLTISWKRRDRGGAAWQDGADMPNSESLEWYRALVYDPAHILDSEYLRILEVFDAQTVTYTAAQQVEDFGGLPTALVVNVAQYSSRVGRGYSIHTFFTDL